MPKYLNTPGQPAATMYDDGVGDNVLGLQMLLANWVNNGGDEWMLLKHSIALKEGLERFIALLRELDRGQPFKPPT